ncbi:hypothetical protein [Magnetofaba australis]|uniref:Response regulator receiver protein n=1 Tax=Magnetofaba australis IT-1 TaxID=1434232 RepID=A0A1Y2K2X8_9PROT|nr:hypothetical protein [Magnetofaba australis]OSM01524.1 hypothetical protein MAIT1_01512 [Magnetofaba australis IT-1]
MEILLLCDNLMTNMPLRSAWEKAGHRVCAKPEAASAPEIVVVDLREKGGQIAALRAQYPAAKIIAFGPHVDGDGLKQAKAEGADMAVARSAVVEKVLGAAA